MVVRLLVLSVADEAFHTFGRKKHRREKRTKRPSLSSGKPDHHAAMLAVTALAIRHRAILERTLSSSFLYINKSF